MTDRIFKPENNFDGLLGTDESTAHEQGARDRQLRVQRERADETAINRIYFLLRLKSIKSPWAKSQTPRSWLMEAYNEMIELRDELPKDRPLPMDGARIQEELGDTIADLISLAFCLERVTDGRVSLAGALGSIAAKIERRMPWLRDGEPPASAEEETRIWNERKALERP